MSDAGKFEEIDLEIRQAISRQESPLRQGLAVLALAFDRFGLVALSATEIAQALTDMGISGDPASIAKAFARGGKRVQSIRANGTVLYRLMLPGRSEIQELISVNGPDVVYFENGTPRKARRRVALLLNSLGGDIAICDPYLGERSLDMLEEFPSAFGIRFLTAHLDKPDSLARAYRDFRKEHPDMLEVRIFPDPKELHDRYILGPDTMLILGHGIKDIGSRESFVISLDRSIFEDVTRDVEEAFERRWAASQPFG